jgi:catechol 2,3-dioxygenase-like lactoylglutathione lyase family enzyme
MLTRVAPEIPVRDLRRSMAYYTEKLGFEVAASHGDYAIVERDGVAIHLFEDAEHTHSPSALHIFTDRIEELHAELEARGAQIGQPIERKPWGNRDFRVGDDSGNQIKFTEAA